MPNRGINTLNAIAVDRPSMRLAVLTTHPIQYNAPVFRRLTANGRLTLRVFYGWQGSAFGTTLDRGFGERFQWDIPLIEGYDSVFVPNTSRSPGTHHFFGVSNPAMNRELRAWMPDVLLIYGWRFNTHLKALNTFAGEVPILFRGDSTLISERRGVGRLARRLVLRQVYKRIDIALYAGEANKQYFLAHGVDESRLRWAPHAIDNERFQADASRRKEEANTLRADWGIAAEDTVCLFAGKLETVKAPSLLLDSFLKIAKPREHLVMVGTGPLRDELLAQAGGAPNVHFVGFKNQTMMPTVLRAADIFVLPSTSETWGLSVNEAMACGVPVIVSDHVGCAADLVQDRDTGVVFESGNSEALSAALQSLLSNKERRCAMGKNAARLIASWSIEEQAKRIEGAAVSATARRG